MLGRSFCCQIIVSNVNVKSFCIYFFEDWFNCSGMDWCGSPRKWKEMCVRIILDFFYVPHSYVTVFLEICIHRCSENERTRNSIGSYFHLEKFHLLVFQKMSCNGGSKGASPQDNIFFNIMGFFRKFFFTVGASLWGREILDPPPSYVVT